MPLYRPGFDEADYERVKAVIVEAGRHGPFDANDALWLAVEAGATNNAGDVAAILEDLADLEILIPLGGGNPPRWKIAE